MIKLRRRFSQKGLSLIEVLIGVVLSSLIMLALLSLYIAGQKYFFNQGAKADAIEDSSTTSEWISRDIRGAVQAVSSYGSYTTSSTMLILEVPSIDGAENVIAGSTDYIIYRQNPGSPNLFERIIDAADGVSVRTDGTRFIADDVSSLLFRYYDTDGNEITSSYEDSFNIHFEIVSARRSIGRTGQPYRETFRSWAKIRNKAFE